MKATIKRVDGTIIEAEGTPEEILKLLPIQWNINWPLQTQPNPWFVPTIAPVPPTVQPVPNQDFIITCDDASGPVSTYDLEVLRQTMGG